MDTENYNEFLRRFADVKLPNPEPVPLDISEDQRRAIRKEISRRVVTAMGKATLGAMRGMKQAATADAKGTNSSERLKELFAEWNSLRVPPPRPAGRSLMGLRRHVTRFQALTERIENEHQNDPDSTTETLPALLSELRVEHLAEVRILREMVSAVADASKDQFQVQSEMLTFAMLRFGVELIRAEWDKVGLRDQLDKAAPLTATQEARMQEAIKQSLAPFAQLPDAITAQVHECFNDEDSLAQKAIEEARAHEKKARDSMKNLRLNMVTSLEKKRQGSPPKPAAE